MSTTIDSLDIQITTSAGAAEQKIDALASALGRLKSNSGLTKVVNNLNKLSGSLNTLNSALSGLSNLNKITQAMQSLAGIQKLTGLNSAVNSLKKIPDIIDKLDDAALAKFTMQMQRLSKALEPLAKQITVVGQGFSKLPSRISSAVTATNKMGAAARNMGEGLDTGSLNLMSFLSNLEMVWGYAQGVIQAMSNSIATAVEWDGIQYRFGRAFGEDAEEVLAYVEKVNDALGINIQQFMQYSSLYGSLLSGFGLAQEKVTTISVGLTELSYDIWAAYNDRFKTLEDASEAVRSAITGEIEPIRNAGIALTEASMQEYLDQYTDLNVSIEKLTEAQKAEVRYAVMVNAAMNQGIVGTYAKEMMTAEGAIRSLSQSTKTLTQAFGSLFIPILQKIIPYVTAFVELITEAVYWIAGLFGIELFKIDWGSSAGGLASGVEDVAAGAEDATGGLNDAAKAAKKLQDYTLGFDELNVIDPNKGSGSGSSKKGGAGDFAAGGGLDLDTLWDESVFAQASKQVDELKQKLLGFWDEWKTEIAIIGAALGALSIASLLSSLGRALNLGDKFLGVMGTIKKMASTAIVIVLQYSLMTEFLGNYIDGEGFKNYIAAMFVGALGTLALYSMWGPTGLVIGLGVIAAASLSAVIDNGGITNVESAVVALTGLASAGGAVWVVFKKLKDTDIGAFFKLLKEGYPVTSVLAATFPKLSSALSSVWGWIVRAAGAVAGFVGGLSAPVWGTIVIVVAAIASAVYFLYENWEKVTKAVKDFWATNIVPKLEELAGHWDSVKESLEPLSGVFKSVKDAVQPLFDAISNFFSSVDLKGILSGIGTVIEVVGGIIFSVVTGVIAGAFSQFVSLIENTMQVFSGIVDIVSGVVELVVAIFTGGDIGKAWSKIWDGVVKVVKGLWGLIVDPIKEFVGGIIDWFTELYDELVGHSIVPDMIDAIVDWFLSLPGKIFKPVQDFVDGIIKKFKDMWNSIKSWYKTNVAPKFTKEYWKTTFDTIRSGLKTKLDEAWKAVKDFFSVSEWKKKVTDAMDTIKKNFKIPDLPKIKLSVTWDKNVGKVKKAVYEALGLDGWPKLSWSTYAKGGFPAMGEMFIAREAGPEMVGTINNRSAVVNNDQIVAAVSKGVYDAVRAAMTGGGSSGQNVNVYLDGKQIYSAVKKTESERGLSLMGNQLGYAY